MHYIMEEENDDLFVLKLGRCIMINIMDSRKRILERLQKQAEKDKARFTFYLSKSVVDDFKGKCGEVSPSNVIEELMRQFSEDKK